jgi:hypothetical protein
VRLRNVARKSARFRISNSRTSDTTATTATATATGSAASSGGVRAVYKPRGPVPAGLTCDVAVELTPGQHEVSKNAINHYRQLYRVEVFATLYCTMHIAVQ